MSSQVRVVQSEIRQVTRNGITETVKTEVIETISSSGTPIRSTRTTTTTSGQKKVCGRSNSCSDSSPETIKKHGISDFMDKLFIKGDKKDQKYLDQPSDERPKGGRPRHSSSSSSDSDSDDDEDDNFAKVCLKQHNEYRSKHGVTNLKLSKSLCMYAQEWAEKCARNDIMRHRDSHKYGENIYMEWSSNPKFKLNGTKPVSNWYSEIRDHRFGTEPRSMGTGHFTQVVWKGSKELGVGIAKSKSGKIFVVANYDPPGNMMGSYSSNVPPPK